MNPYRKFLLVLFLASSLVGGLQAQDSTDAEAVPPAEPPAPTAPQPSADGEGPNIYPWLAAGLLAHDVAVIDVRSAEEVEATGLLADAVNIPHSDTEALIDFIGEDRDRTVVLYCGSGRRVARVIDTLREMGYHGLVNAGGYQDFAGAISER
jgi:phage shock protein E